MITLQAYGAEGFAANWPFISNEAVRWQFLSRFKNNALGFEWNKTQKAWIAQGPEVLLDLDRMGEPYQVANDAKARAELFRATLDYMLELKAQENDDAAEPFAYQRVGSQVLAMQGRGVLADDMGLGKSKQALDACKIVQAKAVLVLCPKTLVYNWVDEITKWYPDWHIATPPEGKAARLAFWDSDESYDEQAECNILVANYEKLLLEDWPDSVPWDVFIMDEAHRVKNRQSQTHKKCKKIAQQAKRVFALTGTPLELRLEELYGIFSVVRPAVFGGWMRFKEAHLVVDSWNNIIGGRNLELLRERIGPWLTRRTKQQVLKQLPPKIYNDVWVDFTDAESKEYIKLVREFSLWLRDNDRSGSEANVLTKLLRMQQFTSDWDLLHDDGKHGSKFVMLQLLLDDWEGRVVVFTRFEQMAARLSQWLKAHPEAYIAGPVDAKLRPERIKRFNNGELGKVLVSTDAGAFGLNITGADLIVHYDQLWNPQKMFQREDRLHRIGQKSTVNVVNLLVRGTIDEGMQHLLEERRQLFKDTIDAAEEVVFKKWMSTGRLKKLVEGKPR